MGKKVDKSGQNDKKTSEEEKNQQQNYTFNGIIMNYTFSLHPH